MALDDGNLFATWTMKMCSKWQVVWTGFMPSKWIPMGLHGLPTAARRREKYDKSKRHRVFAGHG